MARHGNSRHLNRLASSKYPRVSKKTAKYLVKPRAGRHSLERSVALLVILRDKLGLAANSREASRMIKAGNLEVNESKVRDSRYPVGFGDIIKIAQTKETYRIEIGKHSDIKIAKVEGKDSARTLKVIGKYLSQGNKLMLRLYDGSTMQGTKDAGVNDSVIIEKGKMKSLLKLAKGAKCLVVKGAHASETGVIKEITKGSATGVAAIRIDGESGEFETPVDNVMVVGA